jgi:hypothetical protein
MCAWSGIGAGGQEELKWSSLIFYILVILWKAEVVLAPPFYVPFIRFKVLHYVLTYLIGEVLLGYRLSYAESTRATGPVETKKAIWWLIYVYQTITMHALHPMVLLSIQL